MPTNKHLVPIFGLAIAAGVILAGTAYALHLGPWAGSEPQTLDLGPVIARVNGDPIRLEEAAARVAGLSSVHGDVTETLGDAWPDRVLQSLVDDQILRQQAEALGIEVTEDDIESYLDRIEGMVGTDQTMDEWLASQSITLPELERRIELQILGARIYLTVTKDVGVTGEDVRDYYREHRLEFQGADGTVPSLLEVRRSLRESLLKEQRDETYAAWLKDMRESADVIVVLDDWWRDL